MADRVPFRVVTPIPQRVSLQHFGRLVAHLQPGPHFAATGFGPSIARLLSGDVAQAFAMYCGQFSSGGETITAMASEVFEQRLGSKPWQGQLQNLSWLQHFAASKRNLHAHYALRLLGRWAKAAKAPRDAATLSKIVLALAIDGPVLAQMCEADLQGEFFELVTAQTKLLHRTTPSNFEVALLKAIALLYMSTSFQGFDALRKPAIDQFNINIDRLILPDGGHVSRNPQDVLVLLALLLPLKAAMKVARVNFPGSASNAIERMLPFLAMMTHADGGLARFSGNSVQAELIAAIALYDKTHAAPLLQARHSHFARLDHGKSMLLVDATSGDAMEFADGVQRLLTSNTNRPIEKGVTQLHLTPQGTVLQNNSRTYFLAENGHDLRIEDAYVAGLEITLVLEPNVRLTALRETAGILLVTPDRILWQLSWRGGEAHIEKNGAVIKISAHQGQQLNWALKKQTKTAVPRARKRDSEPDLLT